MSNVHVSIVHEIYFSIWKAASSWMMMIVHDVYKCRSYIVYIVCAWNCIKIEPLTKSYFMIQNHHVNLVYVMMVIQTWHLTSMCLNLRDIDMHSNALNLRNLVQRLSHCNAYYLHLIFKGSKHMQFGWMTYVHVLNVYCCTFFVEVVGNYDELHLYDKNTMKGKCLCRYAFIIYLVGYICKWNGHNNTSKPSPSFKYKETSTKMCTPFIEFN